MGVLALVIATASVATAAVGAVSIMSRTRRSWIAFFAVAAATSALAPKDARAAEHTLAVGQSNASTRLISGSENQLLEASESPASPPGTNPNLSAWRADGRPGSVRAYGAVTHVTPLRGNGLSAPPGGVPSQWCGARLQTGAASAQSLVLVLVGVGVGVGVTEALTCDGVKAFGTVPAPYGVQRIASIYRGSSPNATGVSTVVLIERTPRSASGG